MKKNDDPGAFNKLLSKVFVVFPVFLLSWIGLHAQSTLVGWSFTGKGGQSSVATVTVASGVTTTSPSAVASLGAGLTAINYLGNGLTGSAQRETTLAGAIAGNEYISFTITPVSGKSISVTSIKFRPVSQNRLRSFSLFSNKNGFAAPNVIGTVSANGNQNQSLQTVTVTGHTHITTATEFRLYIYGVDQWEACGLGNRSSSLNENDLSIEGTVQNSGTDTVSPTQPMGFVSTSKTTTSVTLNWNPSTDNVGVTGYEIFIGNSATPAQTSTATTVTVSGLSPSTPYSFTVKARDGAGNRSAASAALSVTTSAPPMVATFYEAEGNNVTYSGGNIVSNHANYSGSGFWAYVNTQGNKIVFSNIQATAATSNLICRYANGMDGERTLSLYVNGVKRQVSFPKTANWDTWADKTEAIALNVGVNNTIELRYDAGDNGNINIDYITISGSGTPVPVASVSLAHPPAINVGAAFTLTPVFTPANATNKNVTWISSNPSVATVDATGVINGIAVGTANITVTTVDGNKTATCTVSVTSASQGSGVLTNTSRVLIIGNSLVGWFGGQDEKLMELLRLANPSTQVYIEMISVGGALFSTHVNTPSTLSRIDNGNWDIVVLQGGVGETSSGTYGNFITNGKILGQRVHNAGAICVWMQTQEQTWQFYNDTHFDNGRAHNGIIAGYNELSEFFGGDPVIPIEEGFWRVNHDYPIIKEGSVFLENLLYWDGMHQNKVGRMFHTYMYYAMLTGQSPVGLQDELTLNQNAFQNASSDVGVKVPLPPNVALYLQNVAWEVCSVQLAGGNTSARKYSSPASTLAGSEITLQESITVYPNPAKSNIITASIYSFKDTEAKISMLLPTSKQVMHMRKSLVKGNNTVEIPIENLSNGLHLLVINIGYERVVKKVTVDH